MHSLPTGTITFLFTDIEGSTRLLHAFGEARFAQVLEDERRLIRSAFQAHRGQEVDTQGDAFFYAFSRARDAVAAAIAAQRALLNHPWPEGFPVRVRMGLHTGEPLAGETGYVGMDVHRAARIGAASHGGQIVLSETTGNLVLDDLAEGVSLRALGEYRLKDLARPQRLFQVVAGGLLDDFPRLNSLDILPNNLPVQLTSFVGREREKREVRRLLSATRLLTLTGSGGAGKTRLAIQIAAEALDQFEDGAWFVDLSAVSEVTIVPHTVASSLRIREIPDRGIMETLSSYLEPKTLLLIVDNCEHLLDACARLADTLLRSCRGLRIIATSREPLGISGETTWRIPSLSLPDSSRPQPAEHLARYEAVRLFVERAAAATPDFSLTDQNAPVVAQICGRLDGIPLAIELAAARVRSLSVERIAARLDDRFLLLTGGARVALPRHQTLRAAMDWSYELLSERERAVLRRLSVFAGGFTVEAAESICALDGVGEGEVLILLTQLVDKSLVVPEEFMGKDRYRLLETVRQYGDGRLQEAGEAETVTRSHRNYFLQLSEQASRELWGPNQRPWLDIMETEHDNFRAALSWSTRQGDADGAARLAVALWYFWFVRGYVSEGRRWLEGALAIGSPMPPELRADALLAVARLTAVQADHTAAHALYAEALGLSVELADKGRTGRAKTGLATVVFAQGGFATARVLTEEALALSREVGDRTLMAISLNGLGEVARAQADYTLAAASYEESLALWREVGNLVPAVTALHNLGLVAWQQEDVIRAASRFSEALSLAWEIGDRRGIFYGLGELAAVAAVQGRQDRALRLQGASDAVRETGGYEWEKLDRVHVDRSVSTLRAMVSPEIAQRWEAEGRAMTMEQAVEYALSGAVGDAGH